MKNTPAWTRNRKRNVIRPPVSCGTFNSAGATSGSLPRRSMRRCHMSMSQSTKSPQRMNQNVSERPASDGRLGLGQEPAPRRRLEDPEDDEGETRRRQRRAEQVDLRGVGDRLVGRASRQDLDGDDDEHLAGEDVAPRQVGGEEAADHGADGDGDGRRGGDQAVGFRPLRGHEVAGHQSDDGRHDQHRADALEERPADDEHREVGRQRGGQRAAAVDDATNRERLLAPDDAADLAARDHEAGHHQCVEGDGRLHARDGGAEILGDGGYRHVHDRRVEGHEELAGGEREEDESRTLGG